MSSIPVAALDALILGQSEACVLTWGVHQGMRGAQWIEVFESGRVNSRRTTPGGIELTLHGFVERSKVAALAARIKEQAGNAIPPRDPGHLCSVELTAGEVSWSLHSANGSLPELAAAFTALRDEAEPAEPLLIRPSAFYIGTAVIGGLMTCGLLTLYFAWLMFKLPTRMDDQGVTMRSGKTYVWTELKLRKRVTHEGQIMGYDLIAPDGTQIRLAPGAFADGHSVVRYALRMVS